MILLSSALKRNRPWRLFVPYRRTLGLAIAAACCLSASAGASAADADLGDLTFSRAISMAMEHNRDIRLSQAAVRSAEAATVIAKAAPNPTLTLQTAGINPRAGVGAGGWRDKTVDTTIRVDQTIERGGKREFRTENAHHLERASRADLNDTLRQVRLAVSQAYYDLLAAQDKVRIANETVDLSEQTLAAARKRKKAGDLAGADVDRIAVDALKARNDARQAAADLENARLNLAQLLGVEERTGVLRAGDAWPAPAAMSAGDMLAALIDRRPDVKAAQARVGAALAARRLALASRTRDISVGVQYEHYPVSDVNQAGTGNSYGVSVQIPLFVRYHYEGEIRSAEAALDTARENLEKTRLAARTEIHRSLQDLQSAGERLRRFQDELLTAAGRAADAAEFAFRNGATGAMDVLDARRTYRATQLDAVAAQADYAKSLAAWRAATTEAEK